MRLLLVEDEADLADTLATGLTEAGYQVEMAPDGVEGERLAQTTPYDVMVVDWMLPRQDGITLIQNLRAAHIDTPILMLTALSDADDCVTGLDAGADDYLTKPFAFSVLFARLRALERRNTVAHRSAFQLRIGGLTIDQRGRTAYWNEQEIALRAKEYALLERLVRRANETVSRTVLAEAIWGSAFTTDATINTTVSNLRKALRHAGADADVSIETRRGVGYRLVADTSARAPSSAAPHVSDRSSSLTGD